MDGILIHFNSRILVADAGKALLLRNAGNASALMLQLEKMIEAPPNAPTREQGVDRPGRTKMGTIRSSMSQTDFHQQEEERFFVMLAEEMDRAWGDKAISHVYIVAPPKALSSLRRKISDTMKAKIAAEFAKDFVNLPMDELEKRLAA